MTFSEELLVRPFYSGQLLSTLKFIQSMDFTSETPTILTSYGNFPRPILELIKEFGLAELQLTFTIGRWNYTEWGIPPYFNLAPTGVYAHAWMGDTSKWTRLVQTLSGMFCVSTNLINSTNTAEPKLFPPPKSSENVFYATQDEFKARQAQMPREAVCTENLTPFLELLPCGRHAGLASLINPRYILDNRFHSLNILIEQVCLDKGCKKRQVKLTQTLSAVYNWAKWHERDLSWGLKDILGKDKMGGQCEIEGLDMSNVTLVLPSKWSDEMLMAKPSRQLVLGEFTHHIYSNDESITYLSPHLVHSDIGVNWPKDTPYWDIQNSFSSSPVTIDRKVVGKCSK
jgi:phosphatidylinositol glycan class T